MFADIHTHNPVQSDYSCIRNLTFVEAGDIFSSTEEGLFSVGIHPWDSETFLDETLILLKKWAEDSRLVAIGECGLDKNTLAAIDKQAFVFKKQIELSEQVQKPLIIHCVGCFNQLFEIKKEMNPQQLWIIHGFRGKPELAKQALKMGCALSFGEHYNAQSVVVTPLDKLFVEADESKMSIEEIYASIARVKNCSPEILSAGKILIQQLMTKN